MLNIEELRDELKALVAAAEPTKRAFLEASDKLEAECVKIVDLITRIDELMEDEANDDQYDDLDELQGEAKDEINELGSEWVAYSWDYGGVTRWASSMC